MGAVELNKKQNTHMYTNTNITTTLPRRSVTETIKYLRIVNSRH